MTKIMKRSSAYIAIIALVVAFALAFAGVQSPKAHAAAKIGDSTIVATGGQTTQSSTEDGKETTVTIDKISIKVTVISDNYSPEALVGLSGMRKPDQTAIQAAIKSKLTVGGYSVDEFFLNDDANHNATATIRFRIPAKDASGGQKALAVKFNGPVNYSWPSDLLPDIQGVPQQVNNTVDFNITKLSPVSVYFQVPFVPCATDPQVGATDPGCKPKDDGSTQKPASYNDAKTSAALVKAVKADIKKTPAKAQTLAVSAIKAANTNAKVDAVATAVVKASPAKSRVAVAKAIIKAAKTKYQARVAAKVIKALSAKDRKTVSPAAIKAIKANKQKVVVAKAILKATPKKEQKAIKKALIKAYKGLSHKF